MKEIKFTVTVFEDWWVGVENEKFGTEMEFDSKKDMMSLTIGEMIEILEELKRQSELPCISCDEIEELKKQGFTYKEIMEKTFGKI